MKRVLFAVCLLLTIIISALKIHAQQRVPCIDVVHAIDSNQTRSKKHQLDSQRLAAQFGVSAAWVEHCAQLYGRRLAKRRTADDEVREDQEDEWESEEPSEAGREEAEQGEFDPEAKRRELHSTPTPTLDEQMRKAFQELH